MLGSIFRSKGDYRTLRDVQCLKRGREALVAMLTATWIRCIDMASFQTHLGYTDKLAVMDEGNGSASLWSLLPCT